MKKIIFSLFALASVLTVSANTASDTTITTLNDIIAMESESTKNNVNISRLRDTWGQNTFLNISYNTTKLSSEEFPTTTGPYDYEFDNKLGVGLQWGHTFNFHKNPLGNVLFIGIDYTWMDLNYNSFDESAPHASFTRGEQILNMPWHLKKTSIDYGMSLGPSLTFYPFTTTNSSGAQKVRLQLYFHVGYEVGATFISDVVNKSGDKSSQTTWGHGLFTAFGGNLSWSFIGVGYEMRNANSLNYNYIDDEFDTGKLKLKQQTNRLYLQFRF